MMMSNVRAIITHPSGAHRDDLLAVSVALTAFGCVPVYRREPTIEELEDPTVLVLDTGGRHEPERSNFDHHQFNRDAEPECALSLLVRHLGLEEAFKLQSWWNTTIILDAKGPYMAAKALGLKTLPKELISPVEQALLGLFESAAEVPHRLLDTLRQMGEQLILDAKTYANAYARVQELVQIKVVDGVECFLVTETLSPILAGVLAHYRDLACPGVAVSIAPSDRAGESWVLYRYDDHPRVDFSRLSGGSQVIFAHKDGFIAKLAPDVSKDQALDLVRAALT